MALSETFFPSQLFLFSFSASAAQKNFTVSKVVIEMEFSSSQLPARVVSFSFNLYVIYLSLLLFPFFFLCTVEYAQIFIYFLLCMKSEKSKSSNVKYLLEVFWGEK
jgi:hypothetical protein